MTAACCHGNVIDIFRGPPPAVGYTRVRQYYHMALEETVHGLCITVGYRLCNGDKYLNKHTVQRHDYFIDTISACIFDNRVYESCV